MRVDELAPAPGANRRRKRMARGIGGRGGKTHGRGTKGQGARDTIPAGFEGGQMPLKQRVPKMKGFNNPFRVEYQAVNLSTLNELEETDITFEVLRSHSLVAKSSLIKILGNGELTRKVNVSAHAFSASARAAIEAQGGTVTELPKPFKVRPAAKGNQFTNR
jgi:large subunit ribosomal protein L15